MTRPFPAASNRPPAAVTTAERPNEFPGRPEREREGPIRSRRAQERRASVTGWGGGARLVASCRRRSPRSPGRFTVTGPLGSVGVAGRQVTDPSFGRDWFRIPPRRPNLQAPRARPAWRLRPQPAQVRGPGQGMGLQGARRLEGDPEPAQVGGPGQVMK
ncbi:hypothetical protein H8959_019945 [Pygathrix nigripes]